MTNFTWQQLATTCQPIEEYVSPCDQRLLSVSRPAWLRPQLVWVRVLLCCIDASLLSVWVFLSHIWGKQNKQKQLPLIFKWIQCEAVSLKHKCGKHVCLNRGNTQIQTFFPPTLSAFEESSKKRFQDTWTANKPSVMSFNPLSLNIFFPPTSSATVWKLLLLNSWT